MRFRVIGPGRAGRSFQAALTSKGWNCVGVISRGESVKDAAADVDLVLVTVHDGSIAAIAAAIEPGEAVLVHTSGAKTLDVLAPHPRVASVHPLISLPDPDVGAARLLDDATFAVAGDPVAWQIVAALDGKPIEVTEELRPVYHATAAVTANHLVALCGQVERLAAMAGVPVSAYWEMMALTLDNVRASGAAAALTGPAARGDLATVAAHLRAIGPDERNLYLTLSDAAAKLAGRPLSISEELSDELDP